MRNTAGHYGKTNLALDFATRQLTCPAGVTMAFEPARRAQPRERTRVEHALAHVGHWQGRSARYRGTRKNLSGLRRAAVVHNLHVIARQPAA